MSKKVSKTSIEIEAEPLKLTMDLLEIEGICSLHIKAECKDYTKENLKEYLRNEINDLLKGDYISLEERLNKS